MNNPTKSKLTELIAEADRKYGSYLTQLIDAIDDIDSKSPAEIEALTKTMM